MMSFAWTGSERHGDAVEQRLRQLAQKPGVGSLALTRIIRGEHENDLSKRIEDVSALASATPLASVVWLDLAYYRKLDKFPQRAAAALAMSIITGPNEAYLAGTRAQFALSMWSELPPDLRRSTIKDLAEGWPFLPDKQRLELKEALAGRSATARMELGAALLLLGSAGAEIANTLALRQ